MSRVFISGPMTGYPDFNYLAFNEAETQLKRFFAVVVNPAKTDGGDTSKPWVYYIEKNIHFLQQCNCIYLLRGWERSPGAMIEAIIARKLDFRFLYQKGARRYGQL